ncbi:sulfatase-like hydrolase/transferase [Arthrobacter sp. D1-29]
MARPWSRSESLHPTNWVVTEAISWLYRRDPTVPFFLYLSFHRPHPPYNPPVWAFEQYLNLPDHEPPVGDWVADLEGYGTDHRPDAHVATYDQQTLNRARAGYYGNVTHIDHQIARLMEVLREFGLKEDTYIVFTSDHGEMLGDHGLWRKGYPYEGSSRVPLLISGPGIPGGQRVDAVVELRDLMPTLLDAAHLPVPGSIEGISLFGLTQGDEQGSNVELRPYLHGEHVLLGQSIQVGASRQLEIHLVLEEWK